MPHEKLLNLMKEIGIVAKMTVKEWLDDNMMLHAAGLAFYTIFSLAPLLILVIAFTGFIFGEQAASGQLSLYMEEVIGAELANTVQNFVNAVSQTGQGTFATITSTIVLIFAATTVLTQLKESLNTIWDVDKSKRQPIKMFFINRLLGFLLIIIFSLLLISTFFISTLVSFISPFLEEIFPAGIRIYFIINGFIFLSISTILFSIIYRLLPDIQVRWSDVLPGAFITSVLFLLGRTAVSFYLSNAAMASTYGAAGSFVIFLIWVYYNVMVIFLGAEFTQIWTKRYGSDIKPGMFLKKD
ncbi:membrane protein [Cyclonatronum proteinivorum]|uniref:Membrane protein n=1 Tax=Cyclonatronum proteinivorum TaxID=1457365 RepID=A0A345UKV4_9BACT|nr:YihY/virulence factor BrkB family protein [Cyclonatronum proteinivorum]AXJ01106.1 membrane protein [Cyclonatronum proteinivorum]